MNGTQPLHARAQSGVVLFVAMIVLLVMSLLGMMTAHSAIAENRMAGSERNRLLARMATASALAEARSRIAQAAASFGTDRVCSQVTCLVRDAAAPTDALSFMQTAAVKTAATAFHTDLAGLSGNDATARLAANAMYVIEDLGADAADAGNEKKPARLFHVTAVASGATAQVSDADEIVIAVAP